MAKHILFDKLISIKYQNNYKIKIWILIMRMIKIVQLFSRFLLYFLEKNRIILFGIHFEHFHDAQFDKLQITSI